MRKTLGEQGVRLVIRYGDPADRIPELAADAALAVTDCGHLRIQREWREKVAAQMECPLCQVETNVVVPVGFASEKEEWSAATLRKKITGKLDRFLVRLQEKKPGKSSFSLELDEVTDSAAEAFLKKITTGGEGERPKIPHRLPWQGGEQGRS